MNSTQVVTFGVFLHNILRVIINTNNSFRSYHKKSEYELISKHTNDKNILECILHYGCNNLDNAELANNSLSYIVNFAEDMCSGGTILSYKTDSQVQNRGIKPLSSIFNLLNNRTGKQFFTPSELTNRIKYPVSEFTAMDCSEYEKISNGLSAGLAGMEISEDYINSLLDLAEQYLSYIPAFNECTSNTDISLYDHSKITAALASCISLFLEHNGINDYRNELYEMEQEFRNVESICVFSLDVSGIQSFIYNIKQKGALKSLRSRSFYLEILLENSVSEILASCRLSRSNIMYTGGGHSYLLLPNTEQAKRNVEKVVKNINKQLIDRFGTSLYIAYGFQACSVNQLMRLSDDPEGYSNIFRSLSAQISQMKLRRYSPDEICMLNTSNKENGERECSVCGVSEKLEETEDGMICETCARFSDISGKLIKPDHIIVISAEKIDDSYLPLFSGLNQVQYLHAMPEQDARKLIESKQELMIRLYSNNRLLTGVPNAIRLWMGDYYAENEDGQIKTLEEMAGETDGTERIAVLRADVDNLGTTFVKGFVRETDTDNRYRYVSIARTSSLSRSLSIFFKNYINDILRNPSFSLMDRKKKRNVVIVYSGGDDIFLVGAWDDVLSAAIDINHSLARYTDNALTISAGLSVFDVKYPLSRMAIETAELESVAKKYCYCGKEKNAIALFGMEYEDGHLINRHTYNWDIFEKKVLGEKFAVLKSFLSTGDGYGSSYLYKILELLRQAEADRLNIARLAFLLARREPAPGAPADQVEAYKRFTESIYKCALDNEDRRQLITAIMIFLYCIRSKREENVNVR